MRFSRGERSTSEGARSTGEASAKAAEMAGTARVRRVKKRMACSGDGREVEGMWG